MQEKIPGGIRAAGALVLTGTALFALHATAAPSDGSPPLRGPFALHDPYPLSSLRLEIVPVLPRPSVPGEVRADLSAQAGNTFSVNLPGLAIDAEQWQVWPAAEVGLLPDLALRIEAPFVRRGAGMMDDFLDNYHNVIGVTQGARDDVESEGFSIRRAGGSRGFDLDQTGGLGDVRAALRWTGDEPASDAPVPAFGGRLLMRFPTAAERAVGSPGADLGVAADAALRVGEDSVFFVSLGGMYYEKPGGGEVPFARLHVAFSAGFDTPVSERLSLVGQAGVRSPLLRVDGSLGRPGEYWALGVRLRLSEGAALEAAFLESFTPLYTTFDAGVHAALRITF